MADNYKNAIKTAGWSLLEAKFCPHHIKPRSKLRWIGRMLKRAARVLDRKDREND